MTQSKAKTDTSKAMSSQDRNQVGKIIDARFKLLQEELDIRMERLRRTIRARMISDAKERCLQAARMMSPLIAEAEALKQKVSEAVLEIGQDLSVFPGDYYESGLYDKKGNQVAVMLKTHEREPVALTINNTWAPEGLEEAIQAEIESLTDERTMGGRTLEMIRLEIHERLLTEGIGSDAAAFLEQIPKIEQLVPDIGTLVEHNGDH
jgi:hypothetical protein